MNFFEWIWQYFWKLIQAMINAIKGLPAIYGESTVNRIGTLGHYIDINFQSKVKNLQLVEATWDWTRKDVWVDRDGIFMTTPENRGVDSYEFHFGGLDPNGTEDVKKFGFFAEGFDSGDYFRFTMDLDRSIKGGSPYTEDYLDGRLVVKFSDGTVLETTFESPVNYPWGAKAVFKKD